MEGIRRITRSPSPRVHEDHLRLSVSVEKSIKTDDHAAPSTAPRSSAMTFKNSSFQFQMIDVSRLDPDLKAARKNLNEDAIKGLINSIQKLGIIHPLVVRPGSSPGRYTVIVGERRRQAAILAGETILPAIVRDCSPDATLEVQVFENMGLGVRSALEARDMANAIQHIATQFASPEEAAQHFGRPSTWLNQATAAANLSEKVSALLDSGKIASTGAAVQLEKLVKINEAKAESLIDQIGQLPEGEKISKKRVDHAISEETGRGKKKEEGPVSAAPREAITEDKPFSAAIPLQQEASPSSSPIQDKAPLAPPRQKVNPGKVRQVAEILGLADDDEEEILVRLIDEFLTMKRN